MIHRTALLTVLACLSVGILPAAPLTQAEPPDRPGSGGPIYILDVGSNSISGFVGGCPNCNGSDYQDNFSLTLPAGMTITGMSFSGSPFTNGGGTNPQLGCFTGAGCFGTGFFSGMSAFTGTQAFTATSAYSFSELTEIPGGFSYNLQVDVVSNVPEPASWALVLPAMAGLLHWRRRLAAQARS